MELYQLRAFVAVAEEGHLTRAAKRLHLSQPAVSGQIKALEQHLDLRLFEREASGMTPTAAGRELLVEAGKVLAAANDLLRTAQRYKGSVSGRLRVGTVSDPATIRLGDLLGAAVRRFPQLELELQHEMTGAALDAVREQRLDATFYYGDEPRLPLSAVPLRQLVYRVVAPAAWCDRVRDASWQEIAALPWLLTPEISTHRRLVERLFAEHNSPLPQHQFEADEESLLASLVASGIGVALMREDIALARERAGEVCVWKPARLHTTLWFVCAADRADDPPLKALIGLLRETWQLPDSPPREQARRGKAEAVAG